LVRRGSIAVVVLATAVSAFAWQWPVSPRDGTVDAVRHPSPQAQTLDLAELRVLFSSPPVDPLDQLSQQQMAFSAAVDQIVKE
jgi:hypothetical protein